MKRLLTMGMLVLMGCGAGNEASASSAGETLSYDAFLTRVYQEETGEFIANGDELYPDEAALRTFYVEHFTRPELATTAQGLAIYNISGADIRWSASEARNLTYCVSTRFGSHYDEVVQAMAAAGAAWTAVANVQFVHVASADAKCTATTSTVVFDVNPVNAGGRYLARSFFPNAARKSRNVKIDGSSFGSTAPPDLTGILRHELGHTLGFRHEHTRPESGACFEDNNWRALTTYDSSSVMHYPQCNGTGDWTLVLTSRDAAGARAVYP